MTVGCDVITTLDNSTAFVTGDTLTVLGRTFLGSYFENPAVQASLRSLFLSCLVFATILLLLLFYNVWCQVPETLERIRDVQLALVDLSFCLHEIHVDLLRRTLDEFSNEDFTADQGPMHRLVDLELCFLLWDLLELAHSTHTLDPTLQSQTWR